MSCDHLLPWPSRREPGWAENDRENWGGGRVGAGSGSSREPPASLLRPEKRGGHLLRQQIPGLGGARRVLVGWRALSLMAALCVAGEDDRLLGIHESHRAGHLLPEHLPLPLQPRGLPGLQLLAQPVDRRPRPQRDAAAHQHAPGGLWRPGNLSRSAPPPLAGLGALLPSGLQLTWGHPWGPCWRRAGSPLPGCESCILRAQNSKRPDLCHLLKGKICWGAGGDGRDGRRMEGRLLRARRWPRLLPSPPRALRSLPRE